MTTAEFVAHFQEFAQRSQESSPRFTMRWEDCLPCLDDATGTTGFDRHYVYHLAWAARVVADIKPDLHVDIGSLLHFPTILSAFVPVAFYDYRPADLQLDNMVSAHADLTALPFPDRSLSSLSCMHTAEHVGLGRYGDPLDPDGDLKSMSELQRVIAPGGSLVYVVPIGGEARIVFNAHRIYSYRQVIAAFPELELIEFALIPEDGRNGGLIRYADPARADAERYGCGCFRFRRPA